MSSEEVDHFPQISMENYDLSNYELYDYNDEVIEVPMNAVVDYRYEQKFSFLVLVL